MIEEGQGCFNCLALNSDATFLATGGGCECCCVRLWELEDGKALNSATVELYYHECEVTAVTFSPDSQRLASADVKGQVLVWHMSGNCLLAFMGHVPAVHGNMDKAVDDYPWESGTRALAWSSDSKLLASGGFDQTVQVWDASSGQLVLPPLKGHGSTVSHLAFASDSSVLVSASFDSTIIVWQLLQENRPTVLQEASKSSDEITSRTISPDGKYLVTGMYGNATAALWDLARCEQIMCIEAVKKDKYWKVPLRTLHLMVYLSTWAVLTVLFISPICHGHAKSTILVKC
jgi:WD40 repeat protein